MKILTLVYSIGPGGTERAAVNYAVAYKRAGCESRVWILGKGYDRKPILDANCIKMYFDVFNDHNINKEELILWKPDIIHIHTFNSNFYKILVPFKQAGCKIAETNVFSRPRYEEQYKIVDISFQLANWGFWKYQKWMGNKSGFPLNLSLPYLVYSSDFKRNFPEGRSFLRKRLNLPTEAFIAARVGQAHPSKWDKRIFDVVAKTIQANDNIYFVFVGLPEKLKEYYNKLPEMMKSRIRLIDFLNGDIELTEFYKSIDLFVHISKIGESFGYVLAEALVCGCPVITLSTPFKDNAQFEVVGHQVGGYCATSINEFVTYILKLYTYSSFSKEKLLKHVDNRFSEKVLITPLLQLFNSLCKNDHQTLLKLSKESYKISKKIVSAQLKLYGFKGLFFRLALEVFHTPFFLRLLLLKNSK